MERGGVRSWGKEEKRGEKERGEDVALGGGGGFPDTRFDPAEEKKKQIGI